MSDPEEDPAGSPAQKVRVQTGRFRPISNRYPHLIIIDVRISLYLSLCPTNQ